MQQQRLQILISLCNPILYKILFVHIPILCPPPDTQSHSKADYFRLQCSRIYFRFVCLFWLKCLQGKTDSLNEEQKKKTKDKTKKNLIIKHMGTLASVYFFFHSSCTLITTTLWIVIISAQKQVAKNN